MSDDNRFTEGICGDGAVILDNGKPLSTTEILEILNDYYRETDPLHHRQTGRHKGAYNYS